ncbi:MULTISPECIES: IS3 family transposase [Ureibacillus]
MYFYNNFRYQEKLNGLSPLEHRLKPLKNFIF